MHVIIHSSQQPIGMRTIIPTLQMRKLGTVIVQDHAICRWWCWDLSLGLSDSEPVFLSTRLYSWKNMDKQTTDKQNHMPQLDHPEILGICFYFSSDSGYFCIVFLGLFPEQELLGAGASCHITWTLHVFTTVKAKYSLHKWLFPREIKLTPEVTKLSSNSWWKPWKMFCITPEFSFWSWEYNLIFSIF